MWLHYLSPIDNIWIACWRDVPTVHNFAELYGLCMIYKVNACGNEAEYFRSSFPHTWQESLVYEHIFWTTMGVTQGIGCEFDVRIVSGVNTASWLSKECKHCCLSSGFKGLKHIHFNQNLQKKKAKKVADHQNKTTKLTKDHLWVEMMENSTFLTIYILAIEAMRS